MRGGNSILSSSIIFTSEKRLLWAAVILIGGKKYMDTYRFPPGIKIARGWLFHRLANFLVVVRDLQAIEINSPGEKWQIWKVNSTLHSTLLRFFLFPNTTHPRLHTRNCQDFPQPIAGNLMFPERKWHGRKESFLLSPHLSPQLIKQSWRLNLQKGGKVV